VSWWFNALLIFFTAVLAGVGVIQCFLLYYTYRVTNLSAEAAKQSANVAELALKTGRPYLLPIKICFGDAAEVFEPEIKWPPEGQSVEIFLPAPTITFKNHGQTAAVVRSLVASFEPSDCFDYNVRQHEPHERLKGEGLFNEINSRNSFISNGETLTAVVYTKLTRGWTVTHEQFEKMRSLEWALVAYGRAEYEDTFSNPSRYTTDFCWVVQFEFEATTSDTIKLLWVPGPDDHNRYT
jgi:hypothetical protein